LLGGVLEESDFVEGMGSVRVEYFLILELEGILFQGQFTMKRGCVKILYQSEPEQPLQLIA
jgi:hypothetical protein